MPVEVVDDGSDTVSISDRFKNEQWEIPGSNDSRTPFVVPIEEEVIIPSSNSSEKQVSLSEKVLISSGTEIACIELEQVEVITDSLPQAAQNRPYISPNTTSAEEDTKPLKKIAKSSIKKKPKRRPQKRAAQEPKTDIQASIIEVFFDLI